jgi:acetyltransferase
MDKLFNPGSILVVGVSPGPGNMGRNIVSNLITYGFRGRIFMMGTKEGNVAGQPIHTSFDTLPDEIDMAVLLTPAPLTPDLVDACGRKGIRFMVIESGGFSELASDRKALEERLLDAASRHGIRFVGPNGLGVISRKSGTITPFMRFPYMPPEGRISLLAQSGGVGVVYLHALAAENQGLDKFVSMGNKLSLDESDFMDHIATQGTSDVVCLYLEDVRNGRRFYDSLRSLPAAAVVQKANVSRAGAAAAASHTASLAGDDRLVDAAIKQAGAIRVQDMGTMVSYAMALSLPPVRGNRVFIMSRSGGHAVIASDYAERCGFCLPQIPQDVAEIASSAGRAHVIKASNPLDLGDVFDFERYVAMLDKAVRSDACDAVAFIHVFAGATEGRDSERLVTAARALTEQVKKPIFLCMLTEHDQLTRMKQLGFPLFSGPEILVQSMAASRDIFARRMRRSADSVATPQGMRLHEVRDCIDRLLAASPAGGWMPADDAFAVVSALGIPVADCRIARLAAEAAAAAEALAAPVAMKLLSAAALHKTEAGGVLLNVDSPAAAAAAFDEIARRLAAHAPGASLDGVLVQRMVSGIREVFLGGRRDASFGPVVAVGFGGTYVETLNDISFRLVPVSGCDVDDMMAEVSLFKAFWPRKDRLGGDFPFLKEAVQRVSCLLAQFPEIVELDVNPVKLLDQGRGGVAVDARIRVAPAA